MAGKEGKQTPALRSQEESGEYLAELRPILVPSLILIAAQLPLALVWFSQVFDSRPHYMAFPLALVAIAVLLWLRWPRGTTRPFFTSRIANVLYAVGIVSAVGATIWLSPWFGMAALVAFTGSLFARTNDNRRFGSLISLLAPLLVLLPPPTGIDFDTSRGDLDLMAWIDRTAPAVAQDVFDVLSEPHIAWDYVNLVYGSSMQVEYGTLDAVDSGGGMFSVFSLLVCTAIYIAIRRRPVFRALLLLASAVFWAMACESLELMLRTMGASSFELAIEDGPAPVWLRLPIFLISFVMTVLTDHLLHFLFGTVDSTAIDEDAKFQYWLCRYWNMWIAGTESPVIDQHVRHEVAWLKRRTSRPPRRVATALWVAATGCAVMTAFQLIELVRVGSAGGDYAFDSVVEAGPGTSTLPASLAGCTLTHEDTVVPQHRTPFRAPETTWSCNCPQHTGVKFQISVSAGWPAWHDAVADHIRGRWTVLSTTLAEPSHGLPENPDIPVYSAEYENTDAEYCQQLWCELDGFGEPFEAPLTWSSPASFASRALQRTSSRIRARLFRPQAMVIEVTAVTVGPLPDSARAQANQLLAEAVANIRAAIKSGGLTAASPEGS